MSECVFHICLCEHIKTIFMHMLTRLSNSSHGRYESLEPELSQFFNQFEEELALPDSEVCYSLITIIFINTSINENQTRRRKKKENEERKKEKKREIIAATQPHFTFASH